MSKLMYLNDSAEATVQRILEDKELLNCGLDEEKIMKTLESFKGDEIACSVFLKKYAFKDEDNKIIEFTLEDAKNRWAHCVTNVEHKFKGDIKSVKYFRELYEYLLPAGRQMFALGNDYVKNATLTNCYVTQVEDDSLEGIYDVAKKLARTYSYGGGTGVCIGGLRPKLSKVSNSAKFSTGAVSFMELFSLTTGLIGQCIAKGERVLTNNGLVSIENVNIGDLVWTKKGFVKVLNTLNSGTQKIYKIKDVLGYEIKTSENHIFITENNGKLAEKRLKNFEVGDTIVLIPGTKVEKEYVKLNTSSYISKSGKQNIVNLPEMLDEKLAYILGYSYGDGFVEYDKFGEPINLSLACSNDWDDIKNQLLGYIKYKFNYDAKILPGDGALEKIQIYSKNICNFLKNNRLLKEKSNNIVFPSIVLNSGSSVQMAFLSGYFDADGYAGGKKKGYVFSSVCYSFLQQVKTILISNGIASRNHFEDRSNMGWQDLHSVSVTGAYFQSLLVEMMQRSVKIRYSNHISKRDGFMTPYKASTFGIKYNKYSFCPDNTQYLSTNCFDKLSKNGEKLDNILVKSVVSSLEESGTSETFDLQLDSEHLYFCEGFQVHNSGRRGALMVTIPVDHPDIEEFIEIKHNNTDKVKHANISIKLTDEFMNAVINDKEFVLKFDTHHEKIRETVRAKDLWKKIVQSARDSAEPGLIFWDKAVRDSPSEVYDGLQIHSTNPCGEQFLSAGDACTLASLLLHTFVKNPHTESAEFDFELFKEMVARGVRHLDNIVELNFGRHGLEEQEKAASLGRRIGLGITGLADMLAALRIKYDSKEALALTDEIMQIKKLSEYSASIELASERGSFPLFDPKLHFERGFCATLPEEIKRRGKKLGLRNVAISTIAPNGSLSIIAQCSGGQEPIFAFKYDRFVEMGQTEKKKFTVYHQGVTRFFDVVGHTGELPSYWVAAHEIDYKFRVKLQGAMQKHIDASISSTINLPSDISAEIVGDIYIDAWKEGLKGITVYREGSREGVLVTDEFAKRAGIPSMNTVTHCVRAEGGDKFYIMISYKDRDVKKPYQVFVLSYKQGDRDTFVKTSNALVRMLKEKGADEDRIDKYIKRSKNSLAKLTRFISLSMKLGYLDEAVDILGEHAFAGTLAAKLHEILTKSLDAKKMACPDCAGTNLRMEEGCSKCTDCGFSMCS